MQKSEVDNGYKSTSSKRRHGFITKACLACSNLDKQEFVKSNIQGTEKLSLFTGLLTWKLHSANDHRRKTQIQEQRLSAKWLKTEWIKRKRTHIWNVLGSQLYGMSTLTIWCKLKRKGKHSRATATLPTSCWLSLQSRPKDWSRHKFIAFTRNALKRKSKFKSREPRWHVASRPQCRLERN